MSKDNPGNRKLLDDCFLHDKDRIRHSECLELITSRLKCIAEHEVLPLEEAAGRYIAANITAPRNVPLHTNSAVDGYAFAHADYLASGGAMPVETRIVAGETGDYSLGKGAAARIFTGARLPAAADTVAMQEDCEVSADGKSVHVPEGLKPGANRRLAGEDLAEGADVIGLGERLRPQDIAALASLGFGQIDVYNPLRIAVLSTGDELINTGDAISTGQVFDSNRLMLKALTRPLPVLVTDLGILADDADLIEQAVSNAAKTHDLILTTGGASRGEEDHVIDTIDRLGKRHLWQIAVKPGRPMAFGQIGDCVFMGLPGNPVAAFVCFLLYVRPAITILGGGNWREPQRFTVPAAFSIPRKKKSRREFLRGWLENDKSGRVMVQKFARDGSGLITGLRQATGLIELSEDIETVEAGQLVAFIPFSEFGIAR
jgi:molybdopterin molybdotransferase